MKYENMTKDELIKELEREISKSKVAEEKRFRYSQIVYSSTDMIAFISPDFKYLSVNDEYARTFKMTKDDLLGRTITEVFNEEFFENVIRKNAELCLTGTEVHYDEWFDFPGGRQ